MHGRKPSRKRIRHGSLVRADLICPGEGCGGYLIYKGRSKAEQGVVPGDGPIPLCRYYLCDRCGKPHKQEVIYRRLDRRRDRSKRADN